MTSTTLHQHRTRPPRTAKRTQKLSHTLSSLMGRVNPNAGPVSLAPVNALTLEEIEAKYGTPSPRRAAP